MCRQRKFCPGGEFPGGAKVAALMGCEIEGPDLSKHIAKSKQIDAVLDLPGDSVVLDSAQRLSWSTPDAQSSE
jgi:hypothetical protein